jgi:hypothetical protein
LSALYLLCETAQNQKVDSICALARCGANLNIKTSERGATAMHFAAQWGYTDVVLGLIACGASPDIADKYGCVPLDWYSEDNPDRVTILNALRERNCRMAANPALHDPWTC